MASDCIAPASVAGSDEEPCWPSPDPGLTPVGKAAMIARLRAHILGLERHAPPRGPSPSLSDDPASPQAARRLRWELGCPAFDALLPGGLEANGVHEIKGMPSALGGASAADWLAGIGFAARLAVRRVEVFAGPGTRGERPWVLWCWPKALAGEFGLPSAAGFAYLGLDPSRLLIVETARAGEALNAIEESLKARSLAVVIGVVDEVDLTPARRLSLAAGETATPCLIVTHPASEPAGATSTRWRIARLQSSEHRFDPGAPGASRFSSALERCRIRPESAARLPLILEWSHETRRFDLASVVADLPAQARGAESSAVAPTVCAG